MSQHRVAKRHAAGMAAALLAFALTCSADDANDPQLVLRAQSDTVVSGGPLVLDVVLRNPGSSTIVLCGAGPDWQELTFEVEGENGPVTVSSTIHLYAHIEGTVSLEKDGALWGSGALVDGEAAGYRPYPFSRQGRYQLRARLPVSVCDSEPERRLDLVSQPVVVEAVARSAAEDEFLPELRGISGYFGVPWPLERRPGCCSGELIRRLPGSVGTRFEPMVALAVANAYWEERLCANALPLLRAWAKPDGSLLGFVSLYELASCLEEVGSVAEAKDAYALLLKTYAGMVPRRSEATSGQRVANAHARGRRQAVEILYRRAANRLEALRNPLLPAERARKFHSTEARR